MWAEFNAYTCPELKELANTIKQCGFAGYQESIINLFIDNIKKLCHTRPISSLL